MSSLTTTLNNALSGLQIAQQSLQTISGNVSNANTKNYSREVVNQSANIVAGQVEGVSLASITREVDLYLNKAVQQQGSLFSTASTLNDYAQNIQNLLGQPGGTSSIDASITGFFTALQSLAANPSQSSLQLAAVNAGATTANQVSQLANGLYDLQNQADLQISTEVTNDNSTLSQLNELNTSINNAYYANQSTAGLLDQRDALLNTLGNSLDIRYFFNPSGTVSVTTSSGQQLLGGGTSYQLSYSPLGGQTAIEQGVAFQPVTIQQIDQNGNNIGQPVDLVTGGTGSQVTTSMQTGTIAGLLQMRDQDIPDALNQLDGLASGLRDAVNAVQNSGTGYPGVNSYTGTRQVGAQDASQWSGSVRIGVLDSSGQPVSSPYADEINGYAPLTLDLGSLDTGDGAGKPTVQGTINAINSYFTPQNKAELGDLNNIQMVSNTATVSPSHNSFNLGFNLENLQAGSAGFFVTGTTVQDDSGHTLTSSNTLPSLALDAANTYSFGTPTGGTTPVTITVDGTNTLHNGDTVYLSSPPPNGGQIDGINTSDMGGFFTVSNVSGNSFQISVSGTATAPGTFGVAGQTALTNYATAAPGAITSTSANGTITADFSSYPNSAYYLITENVAVVNADGTISQGTVQYQVNNSISGAYGQQFAAVAAGGSATLVKPTSTTPLLTAELVDANGNPLPEVNGQYSPNASGFLKLVAASGDNVAIDSMNSTQLGLTDGTTTAPGTNLGFSGYFSLNNFFNNNALTATGDTVKGSAINLSVAQNLISNPGEVSTSVLALGNQSSAPGAAPNYTYQLFPGDNSIIQNMANLSLQEFNFAAAGGMGATTTTFNGYAGSILDDLATGAQNYQNDYNNQQTILNGFTSEQSSTSGVNLDQELANMIIYQNAYAASAKLITVTNQLFTTLISTFSGG